MTSIEELRLAVPYDGAAVDVAELVRDYSGVMFRVAHAVLRSRGEAEDVVQGRGMRMRTRSWWWRTWRRTRRCRAEAEVLGEMEAAG